MTTSEQSGTRHYCYPCLKEQCGAAHVLHCFVRSRINCSLESASDIFMQHWKCSLEVAPITLSTCSSCDLELWTMTLTLELDLDGVSMPAFYVKNHLVWKSYCPDSQTHWTCCSTWTTKVIVKNSHEWGWWLVNDHWYLSEWWFEQHSSVFRQWFIQLLSTLCVLYARRKVSRVSWSFCTVNWQLPVNKVLLTTTASRPSRLCTVRIYFVGSCGTGLSCPWA